jgi:hypothetical protein
LPFLSKWPESMGQAGRGSHAEAGHKAAMNAEEVKEVDLAETSMLEPRHYQRCRQSNYDLVTARPSKQRWPQWNGGVASLNFFLIGG